MDVKHFFNLRKEAAKIPKDYKTTLVCGEETYQIETRMAYMLFTNRPTLPEVKIVTPELIKLLKIKKIKMVKV